MFPSSARGLAAALATALVAGGMLLTAAGCSREATSPPPTGSGEATPTADPTAAALQVALAGEYAASYAYGVIGGRLNTPADQAKALAALDSHQDLRDELRARLLTSLAKPTSPAAAYQLPFTVHSPTQARALAVDVETKQAVLWDQVAAAGAGAEQQQAVAAAAACRKRAAQWSKVGG